MPKEAAKRQEHSAEGQKPEHRAEDGGKQHEDPILPLADIQCQKEIAGRDDETETGVEPLRQPPRVAAQTA